MHLTSRGTAAAAAVLAVSATLAAAAPAGAAPAPAPTSTGSASRSAASAPTSTPAPAVTPSPTPRAPLPVIAVPVPSPTRSIPVPLPTPTPPAPVPLPTPTPTPTPVPVVPSPVGTRLSLTSGRTSLVRTVTMTGSHLGNLANVYVGGVAVTALAVLDDSHARFVIPSAVDWQAGARKLTLRAGSDWIVRATHLTFTYLVTTRVERQMAYAFQNWNRTSSARFGYLSDNDCANFTSQTLLARGWKPSSQWFDAGQGDWSATWVSSTAMSDWLKRRPDLATHLLYRQRDQVVVGDIVQFHWGWSTKAYTGWDHTAVVSKVVVLPNGRHDIYYVAHTNNSQYGGSTQYFAQHFTKRLRIQFFHILH